MTHPQRYRSNDLMGDFEADYRVRHEAFKARLIEAAPDLLGALEAALEHIEISERAGGLDFGAPLKERCRQAIAKATGS